MSRDLPHYVEARAGEAAEAYFLDRDRMLPRSRLAQATEALVPVQHEPLPDTPAVGQVVSIEAAAKEHEKAKRKSCSG
jgi:hypothetical protein